MSIDAYAAPKRPIGLIIALAVVVVSIIVGVIGYGYATRDAGPTPTPTPTSPVSSDLPTSGQAFEATGQQAKGTWEILDTQWSSSRVTLTVRITVTSGNLGYNFYAYDANGTAVVYPDSNSGLRPSQLSPGQTAQGTVTFQLPRGNGTLILTDSLRRPISGLPIKG